MPATFYDMWYPVLSPEHAPQSALPSTAPPSLNALRRRPQPVSEAIHAVHDKGVDALLRDAHQVGVHTAILILSLGVDGSHF
jgi:hypothetical protein